MADAKKCDVCGKFYDYYQGVTLDNGKMINGCKIRFTSDNNTYWSCLDLCQECMTKVHTLLYDISSEKEA